MSKAKQGAAPEANTRERIGWFLQEQTVAQSGYLLAWHYLFMCYKSWRRSYGLLATELSEAEFATAVEACGVRTSFARRLFFDVTTRDLLADRAQPKWKTLKLHDRPL